ncbi:MAG: GNAT family N-acetyltransferase [Peptostreptococcaceae bacterium]
MDKILTIRDEIDFSSISNMNQFAKRYEEIHSTALKILNGVSYDDINEKAYLFELELFLESIPASSKFRSNVNKRFLEGQINFTIQNFLTWHYVDSILLSYFNQNVRFDKLKECAVTEVDFLIVESLGYLLERTDLSIDERRYCHLRYIAPKLVSSHYLYSKTDEEISNDYNKVNASKNASNSVSVDALSVFTLIAGEINPLLEIHLMKEGFKKNTKFGACNTSPNRNEDILYNGLKGLYMPLEKGEVVISDIDNLDSCGQYFINRRNAYLLMNVEGAKFKAAYLNKRLIGVVAFKENSIINIHVDGDYRLRGVAKALISDILKESYSIAIIPIGDSLDFVRRVGKYNKSKNMAIVTKDSLESNPIKKSTPKNLEIVNYLSNDYEELVSDTFKDYFNKNCKNEPIKIKVAVVGDEIVGYIMFDDINKKIILLEIANQFRNMSIGKKLIEEVIDDNIWSSDIAKTGALFWFGKGVNHKGTAYMSKKDTKLKKFMRKNNMVDEVVPIMYVL